MVLATAVPSRKAARKLKAAAQITASRGESTRVETTVAMLLAASWKPLKKSKMSAVRTVMISRTIPLFTVVRSGQGLGVNASARSYVPLSTTVSSTSATSSALSLASSRTSRSSFSLISVIGS